MLQRTSIWTAGVDEAAAVARLLGEFRDWWGNGEPSDAEMLASVRRIMAGGDGEFLLGAAGVAEEPHGVCQIRFRWSVWKGAEDCWLEDLYVREAARRAGLGRALVEGAVARARERGCRRIELDVNEDEWDIMKQYPLRGAEMLERVPGLGNVARIVMCEHEHWDGSGYPQGIAGEEIPLASRIVLVCDAYDAMTSDRPWRSALKPWAAVRELRAGAGREFDPQCVVQLIGVLRESRASTAFATLLAGRLQKSA